jgi:Ca2+-binding RTX toxin-like protein
MSTQSKQQVLNDDGTVRRKYEIDAAAPSFAIVQSTIGLVLANAFVLVKNVLFATPAQPSKPVPAPPPQEAHGDVQDQIEFAAASVDGPGPAVFEEEEPAESADFVRLLLASHSQAHSVGEAPAKHGLGGFAIPHAANGNVPLYGAAPGRGIAATSDGSSFAAQPARGGDGGSGGGGETPDGRDDDDSDDDPRPVNRRPVVTGPVDLGKLFVNQSLVIGLLELLRHASDPDGDTLSIGELVASSGRISARADGGWLFTPADGDTTHVTFTYNVGDGEATVAQTATVDLVETNPNHIDGTLFDDRLVGTPGDDVIFALAGDDVVIGLGGNERVDGGDGNDRIVTGAGNDLVYGGDGDDVVFTGAGNDVAYGGRGNDVIYGEDGDDTLFGDAGNDHLYGGVGRDYLDGGIGNDVLTGGKGNDTVRGDLGDDVILATYDDGNDVHDGGTGNDTLDLSALTTPSKIGNGAPPQQQSSPGSAPASGPVTPPGTSPPPPQAQQASTSPPPGDGGQTASDAALSDEESEGPTEATLDDNAGEAPAAGEPAASSTPTADEAAASPPRDTSLDVIIDLERGTADGESIGHDVLISIENVVCGGGNDIIIASDAMNILAGGDGDDTFVFRTSAAVGNGHGSSDRILDFAVGDRIDLHDISREFERAVDMVFQDDAMSRFILIQEQAAFSRPGQMRFKYDNLDGRDQTILEGNIDFDDDTDFALIIMGHHTLTDQHFTSGSGGIHGHG